MFEHGRSSKCRIRTGRPLTLLAAFVVAAMVLTACGSPSRQAAAVRVGARSGSISVAGYLRGNQYLGVYPQLDSSLNAYSPDYIGLSYYAVAPLAIAEPPRYGVYTPDLARQWSVKGDQLTIRLREARWSDGRPVTAKDVLSSLILDGLNGDTIWHYLRGATASQARTLLLDVKGGVDPSAILFQVLTGTFPVSPVQYGRFLKPGLEKDLLTDTNEKQVTAADKKLVSYSPKTFIGDGPFEFVKLTSSELVVKKSLTYWAAKDVHVPGMTFTQFASNSAVWAAFEGEQLDMVTVGATYTADQSMRHTNGGHVALANNYFMFTFAMNNHTYPLDLVKVRQAIAYVIKRNTLAALIGGHAPATLYPGTPYPSGLPKPIELKYLSKKQLKSLNPYKYNPAKAAQLLESAGFHKSDGKWIMPNGKPFKLTINTQSGEDDSITFADGAANMLSNFGISSKAVALSETTLGDYLDKGNYELSIAYPTGFTPLSTLVYELATINESATGRGLGVRTASVPGLGTVDVPATILKEYETVGPGPEMSELVYDWARYVDEDLPYLTVTDRNLSMPYSTSRFDDWPAQSNPLWKLAGANPPAGFVSMMTKGFIRPKS